MAFDGVVTRSIVYELNKILKGAKVNRVLEPNKNEVVLELYNNERYYLDINITANSCRVCLTEHLKSNPQNAFNFCMLLRKYLVGSKILEISNYDLERTIEIKFEGLNSLNDLVKDSIRHFENDERSLLPARPFTFTPILKSSFLELETFSDFLELISQTDETKLSRKSSRDFYWI